MITQVRNLKTPLFLKFGKAKTFKNRCDLRQLTSLSANISGIDEDNLNGVTRAILSALNKKKLVKFRLLRTKL